jgi:hypothetical protein
MTGWWKCLCETRNPSHFEHCIYCMRARPNPDLPPLPMPTPQMDPERAKIHQAIEDYG